MSNKQNKSKKIPHTKQELHEAKIAIVCVALLTFTYFSWYAYNTQVNNVKDSDLPIISAPKQVKFKPLDPGGLIVANRDKYIYDHVLGKRTAANKKVKAIGESEAPVEKTEISALVAKQLKSTVNK